MDVIRLLLVDDDPLVRSGLRFLFDSTEDLRVVAEAGDGDEVVAAVRQHRPHVVLMDLRMNRVDGVEATRRVRALPEAPFVIALTTWDVDEAVLAAVEAGASGFLLKTGDPRALMDAVRAVVAGDSVLSPRSTRQLLDHVRSNQTSPRQTALQAMAALTDREREVATAVARGLTNAEIGKQLYVSDATVKSHLSTIQTKLDVRNRVGIAVLAERAGLVDQG